MDDRFVYVFIHLFKTGGTTITGHVALHLEKDRDWVMVGTHSNRVREEAGEPQPIDWPEEQRRGIKIITGHGTDIDTHQVALGREPRYFTIFRDPAPLMVSRYNFFLSRRQVDMSFDEWYPTRKPNENHRRMRRLLHAANFGEMKDALRRFWYVGATETLNEDLPHIFATWGLPTEWKNRRVAGAGSDLADIDTRTVPGERFAVERRLSLTDEIRDKVYADNEKDLRLYHFAVGLRQEMIERLGWT
jgi:hypothetical protein